MAAPLDVALSDPDDAMLLEVVHEADAEHLVPGNLRHNPAGQHRGVRVVTPAAFLKHWTG